MQYISGGMFGEYTALGDPLKIKGKQLDDRTNMDAAIQSFNYEWICFGQIQQIEREYTIIAILSALIKYDKVEWAAENRVLRCREK